MATVNLTVPQTLDAIVWFTDRSAFYQFLGNCSITISSADVPQATTTTYGTVKTAIGSSYIPNIVTPASVTINDGATSNDVAASSFVDAMWARLQQVEQALTDLKTAMAVAGSLDL